MPFFPFTSLHVCVWEGRRIWRTSWEPRVPPLLPLAAPWPLLQLLACWILFLGGWHTLDSPSLSFFSLSPYARGCIGQIPHLPHSCCGPALRSQSNLTPDLAFWVLGYWKRTERCCVWEERESPECPRRWKATDSHWGAPELNTGHC